MIADLFKSVFWRAAGKRFKGNQGMVKRVQDRILSSKAPGTIAAYNSWYAQYHQFLKANSLSRMEGDPIAISAFLEKLLQENKAGSTIGQALAAISWALGVRSGGKTQQLAMPAWVASAACRIGPAPKSKNAASLQHLS